MTSIRLATLPSRSEFRLSWQRTVLISTLCTFVAGCDANHPVEVQPPTRLQPSVMGGPPLSAAKLPNGPPRTVAFGAAAKGPQLTPSHTDGPPRPASTASLSEVAGGARFSYAQTPGTPTVLFDNTSTGDRKVWRTSGATLVSTVQLGSSATDWHIVGAADFRQSGSPDILLENYTTGEVGLWVMNGLTVVDWISYGTVPTDWHVVGAGDLSSDGTPDMLWENVNTGVLGFWTMNGTTITGWIVINGGSPLDWQVVGVADLTGDGKADIIWGNSTTGDCGYWTMDGSRVVTWNAYGAVPTDWHIIGAADFYGDGQIDLPWANRVTGTVGVWRMVRATITNWEVIGTEPLEWQPRTVLPVPEPVVAVSGQALKAGGLHNCGLTAGGVAYCWGRALYGQVGNGTHPDIINAPVMVSGGLSFSQIAPGEDHSCGLTSAGDAYCWGQEGAFADHNGDRLTPQLVPGGLKFTQLVAGQLHTCGLTNAQIAYCWGFNDYGSLGDGTNVSRPTPTQVAGASHFATLIAGGLVTCGLLASNGAAYCWGANPTGALGDGSATDRWYPTGVIGGHTFASLTTGGLHTCGLTSSGVAYCWGQDPDGELGDGAPTNARWQPVLVRGGLTFSTLAAGNYQTCGLTSIGVAYCWGLNDFGEIGDGTSGTPRTTPKMVSGGLKFGTLVAGFQHTCGLTFSGTAYCWGDNTNGQVGDGTTSTSVDRTTPTLVSGGLLFRNP